MAARLVAVGVSAAVISSAASPTSAPSQPNLLLLFPDQWRADWAGSLEGLAALRMPAFEAVAAAGTRFRSAFVPSPLCAPSRACLASGREYDEAGVPDNFSNDYPLNVTTFYTLLQRAGYHTMVAGKDDLTKATGPSIDGSFHAAALGFSDFLRMEGKEDVVKSPTPTDPYGDYCSRHNASVDGMSVSYFDILYTVDKECCTDVSGSGSGYHCEVATQLPQPAYEDDYVAAAAVTLLSRKPAGKPWLLHVSFPGPHPPFIITETMRESTLLQQFPPAVDNDVLSRADGNQIRQLYAAELEHLDALFAQILAKVDALGERDNTIIIIASDHGEELGDHQDWGKTMPWQGSASVPLVFSAPALGIGQGKVVAGVPVATLDIAGTLLDFAGSMPAQGMTTQSLKGVLLGTGAYNRPFVSSGLGAWRMVLEGNTSATAPHLWKFVCCRGACPGAPSNSTSGTGPEGFVSKEWRASHSSSAQPAPADAAGAVLHTILLDVIADASETGGDMSARFPDVAARLRAFLPAGFCV